MEVQDLLMIIRDKAMEVQLHPGLYNLGSSIRIAVNDLSILLNKEARDADMPKPIIARISTLNI